MKLLFNKEVKNKKNKNKKIKNKKIKNKKITKLRNLRNFDKRTDCSFSFVFLIKESNPSI